MRVVLAIDADNLFHSAKSIELHVDPSKLRAYCSTFGELVSYRYYASTHMEQTEGKSRFYKALMHLGYSVIFKKIKTIRQSDGTIKHKSAMDVKIAVDALTMCDQYDMYILVSGDSDFIDLVETLQAKGKRVMVISTDQMVSTELRNAVGQDYINLQDIRKEIEKTNGQKAN